MAPTHTGVLSTRVRLRDLGGPSRRLPSCGQRGVHAARILRFEPAPEGRPRSIGGRVTLRTIGLVLVAALAAPASANAQLFFAATASPDLRIAPFNIRATVTPTPGPVPIRLLFSIAAPPGTSMPDLFLLWPGKVKGDPSLGPRDPALAEEVAALRYSVVEEGRLTLRARRLEGPGGAAGREFFPGGAPYVTFIQTGGALGPSGPATWIRIPAWPRLSDTDWIGTLEIPSLSAVRPKPATVVERWFLGDQWFFAMTFHEVRGRPLFRMYLAHRDRVVKLGDAPAEMSVSFSEASHLKLDNIVPAAAVRGFSGESSENTETVSLYLDTSENAVPQRLAMQYGYFSRTQAVAVVAIPVVLLLLGYSVGPLVGRATLHVVQRLARRFHVSGWNGEPRERRIGVVLAPDVLARIRPGTSTYDDVLKLCGPDAEVAEHFPSDDRRTLVYHGRRVRPQTRQLFGWLSTVRSFEVERQEVTIEFEGGVVRDVKAIVRRSRLPVGESIG